MGSILAFLGLGRIQFFAMVGGLIASLALGAAGAWWLRGLTDERAVSRAETAQARAEKAAEQSAHVLADYTATEERNRADANQKAFDEVVRASRAADALRSQLVKERQQASAASDALRGELRNAAPSDVSGLSPSVRAYLRGVSNRPGADSASARSQNP